VIRDNIVLETNFTAPHQRGEMRIGSLEENITVTV
jgi:hypothetical protein